MGRKLTQAELKKCLRDVSWNQLETIICDLYKESDQARLYFNSIFSPEESQDDILASYEKKIARCFAFNNPSSPDMKTCRKIVSDVLKLATPEIAADVVLTFVEYGTDFTNTYGDINESFYNSIMRAFLQFVNLLNAEKDCTLYKKLEVRIENVVNDASGIGWGFGDEMDRMRDDIVWRRSTE
ncbi:MAG: DUF6155 family protein [Clostridiales bacterium]|nr:DUF6155 family protein [Clostridiales bacterium]